MFKYDKEGNLTVSIYDFVDMMPEGAKKELIELLSCQDNIIEHVRQQVFEGYTNINFLSAGEVCDDLRLSTPLQQFREDIRQTGDDMLRKEIERLRELVEDKRRHYESGWDEYNKLTNTIHDQYGIIM